MFCAIFGILYIIYDICCGNHPGGPVGPSSKPLEITPQELARQRELDRELIRAAMDDLKQATLRQRSGKKKKQAAEEMQAHDEPVSDDEEGGEDEDHGVFVSAEQARKIQAAVAASAPSKDD